MKDRWKLTDEQKDLIPVKYQEFGKIRPVVQFFYSEFHISIDRTTIYYHIKKRAFDPLAERKRPAKALSVPTVARRIVSRHKYADLLEERLNPGHDYSYYLKVEEKKKHDRQYHPRVLSVIQCKQSGMNMA